MIELMVDDCVQVNDVRLGALMDVLRVPLMKFFDHRVLYSRYASEDVCSGSDASQDASSAVAAVEASAQQCTDTTPIATQTPRKTWRPGCDDL